MIPGDTAFACLDRLSARASMSKKSKARANDHIERDILSINSLIDIARRRGFEAKLNFLDWIGLQAATSAAPVLLVLRNGSVVTVLRNRDTGDEIVVSDPRVKDGGTLDYTQILLNQLTARGLNYTIVGVHTGLSVAVAGFSATDHEVVLARSNVPGFTVTESQEYTF